MIIVNFKLWYLFHIVFPTLAIVLTVSLAVASTLLTVWFVIKRWIERVKGHYGK